MNRSFSWKHTVFAWLCLLLGYGFIRFFPVSAHPLGGFLFVWLLFGATTFFLWEKKPWKKMIPTLIGASALVLSPAFLWLGNGTGGKTFCNLLYLWSAFAYLYWVCAVNGNTVESRPGQWFFFDLIKALFLQPFQSFGTLFPALSGNKKGQKALSTAGWILLGLVIAMIPALLVFLMLSYDAAFTTLMGQIFNLTPYTILKQFFNLILAVPVALCLFSAAYSSAEQKSEKGFSPEKCKALRNSARFLPFPLSAAGLFPFFFLYAVFFLSQWSYFTSAFNGLKPAEFSYANYARQGFFELFAVSTFNLILLLLLTVFTRRKNKGIPHRILASTLSVFTLILIATALSKIILYIKEYGLTPKRVYASCFMVFLAVCFLLILLRQCFPKLNLAAILLISAFLFCGSMVFSEPDARIAQYNVNAYLSGHLKSVDIDAMEELGDSALPYLIQLTETLEERHGFSRNDLPKNLTPNSPEIIYQQAVTYLQTAAQKDAPGLTSRNITYFNAHRALQRWIDT